MKERMEHKEAAAGAFTEANPVDRVMYGNDTARFDIITTGKVPWDVK